MKNLILVFAVLISLQAKAQDFAPVGSKWHFTNLESAFAPFQGYEFIESVGDTVIQGKTCQKLERILYYASRPPKKLPAVFIYTNSDTVSMFAKNDTFYTLYNFNAEKGDSRMLKHEVYPGSNLENIEITVDSVGTKTINSKTLKVLYTSSSHKYMRLGKEIVEKLGCNTYMFPQNYAFLDGDLRYGLRCYSDADFGNYPTSEAGVDCEKVVNIKEFKSLNFNVFPNPSSGIVQINLTENQNAEVVIFDVSGRIVTQKRIGNTLNFSCNLPGKGAYFIKIISGNSVGVQKVMVH